MQGALGYRTVTSLSALPNEQLFQLDRNGNWEQFDEGLGVPAVTVDEYRTVNAAKRPGRAGAPPNRALSPVGQLQPHP